MSLPIVPAVLDYLGVAAFAARAAISVRRRGSDVVATMVLATVAGIGGGTTRDLLIGARIFWIEDTRYLFACVAAAFCAWLLRAGDRHPVLIDLIDAVGIGAYAVIGALKAIEFHLPPAASVAMGVITATWGGLMREVLSGEETVLARKDVYVTAALTSALLLVLLLALGCPMGMAALLAGMAGASLRIAAVLFGLQMPGPRRVSTPSDRSS